MGGGSGYGYQPQQLLGAPQQQNPIGSRAWRQEHPVMGASGWLKAHPNYVKQQQGGGSGYGYQPQPLKSPYPMQEDLSQIYSQMFGGGGGGGGWPYNFKLF